MSNLLIGIIFISLAVLHVILNYFFAEHDKKYYDKETLSKINDGPGWHSSQLRMLLTVITLLLAGTFLVLKHVIGF